MRSPIPVCLAIATLLSGCAIDGVVVEKKFRPFPFIDSVGMDGVYKFRLRDSQGNICSQLVTPEVFSQYEVREYFNDLQPARRSRLRLEEIQTVRNTPRVSQHTQKQTRIVHAQHAKKRASVARAHHAKKRNSVAHADHAKKHHSKAQTGRKRAAGRSRHSSS